MHDVANRVVVLAADRQAPVVHVLAEPVEVDPQAVAPWYTFDVEAGEIIEVKLGVSYVSIENARENLRAEQDGFNLEKIAQDAFNQWNEKLSVIEIEGGTDDDK
ncbi:MAG: hypothetical protein EA423_01670, partial [Phycisphaerales bacterium]